jgi:hypothetical protein
MLPRRSSRAKALEPLRYAYASWFLRFVFMRCSVWVSTCLSIILGFQTVFFGFLYEYRSSISKYTMGASLHILTYSSFIIIFPSHSRSHNRCNMMKPHLLKEREASYNISQATNLTSSYTSHIEGLGGGLCCAIYTTYKIWRSCKSLP